MGLIDNLKQKMNIDFEKVKNFVNECCAEDRKRAMKIEKKEDVQT